tara:strand:- start:110 stop:1288 length:1179 start_codon:yes stop_codon:yes gene_type:complete
MKLIKLLKIKIMKKHKICIIGDGLSGLVTAQILSKLDIQIDLISKKDKKKIIDNRTTALSPSNFKFLSAFLNNKINKFFFSSKEVDLYFENEKNSYINFIKFKDAGKNIMHIIENKNLIKYLKLDLKKNKKVKFLHSNIKNIKIDTTSIEYQNKINHYDMIFLCVGRNNKLVEELIGKRFINKNKKETALSCIVSHNGQLNNSKQYFLKEGPMALLPINSKKFSLIWSVNTSYFNNNKTEVKKNIALKLNSIFSIKTKFILSEVNNFDIYFKFYHKFFNKNIFAIGESVYNVHPIAGQGFNLVLRDIKELNNKIKKTISLGMQIKDSLIFEQVYKARKPENFIYGLGIDFTQQFFRDNKFTEPFKKSFLKDLNKFAFLKKIGLKIADKGIIN